MRHTEFWERMAQALGSDAYARTWSDLFVMASLGNRTASQALAEGETPKVVWRAVHEALELPSSQR